MWIIILNFLTSQIEVVNLDEVVDDEYKNLHDYDKADAWISNNVNQSVCQYMIINCLPSIYNHNDKTTIDYPSL